MLTGFVGSGTTPCSCKFFPQRFQERRSPSSATPITTSSPSSLKVRWYCRLLVYANSLQNALYSADTDDGGELRTIQPLRQRCSGRREQSPSCPSSRALNFAKQQTGLPGRSAKALRKTVNVGCCACDSPSSAPSLTRSYSFILQQAVQSRHPVQVLHGVACAGSQHTVYPLAARSTSRFHLLLRKLIIAPSSSFRRNGIAHDWR